MTAGYPKDDIVISDATVLINFLEIGHFDILLTLYGGKLHITDAVLAGIRRNPSALRQAITDGKIHVDPISLDEIERATKIWGFHAGEASCYGSQKQKSWRIATDDGHAKDVVRKDLGSLFIITTFDVIVEAVALSIIRKVDAIPLLDQMKSLAYFTYREGDFKKFQDDLKRL